VHARPSFVCVRRVARMPSSSVGSSRAFLAGSRHVPCTRLMPRAPLRRHACSCADWPTTVRAHAPCEQFAVRCAAHEIEHLPLSRLHFRDITTLSPVSLSTLVLVCGRVPWFDAGAGKYSALRAAHASPKRHSPTHVARETDTYWAGLVRRRSRAQPGADGGRGSGRRDAAF
jgi:hypothetical protein